MHHPGDPCGQKAKCRHEIARTTHVLAAFSVGQRCGGKREQISDESRSKRNGGLLARITGPARFWDDSNQDPKQRDEPEARDPQKPPTRRGSETHYSARFGTDNEGTFCQWSWHVILLIVGHLSLAVLKRYRQNCRYAPAAVCATKVASLTPANNERLPARGTGHEVYDRYHTNKAEHV